MFITDVEGQVVFKENITSEIPSNILDIIFSYLSTDDSFIPLEFHLKQNYPNPFNSMTSISYDLAKNGMVNLSIFDINGKIIKNLVNEFQNAGNYSLTWDVVNFAGEVVSAGLYLYVLQVGDTKQTKKMSFIK